MTLPANAVQRQGQGVISADQANTYVQWIDNVARLRGFIGTGTMEVYLQGYVSVNDGGEGPFYWNVSGTGPDDGGRSNVVPNGSTVGCWTRLGVPGGAGSSFLQLVANIAALRTNTVAYTAVYVLGYTTGADGGEGEFWRNAADTTSADNGGTIIVDAAGHRWYRETNGLAYSVQWFGAKSNGTTDDSTAVQNAINAVSAAGRGSVLFPPGTTVVHGVTLPVLVSVYGAGNAATRLVPSANSQTILSFGALTGNAPQFDSGIYDLAIDALSFTGITGISGSLAREFTVSNVMAIGCQTSLVIDRGDGYFIRDFVSRGNPVRAGGQIKLWSSDDTKYLFNIFVTNIFFENIGNGFQLDPLLYMRRVVGAVIVNVMSNDGSGNGYILMENDCQGNSLVNVNAADVSYGLKTQNGSGPSVSPGFTVVSNLQIDGPLLAAVDLEQTNFFTLIGGFLTAESVHTIPAIIVTGSVGWSKISDVTIHGFDGVGGIGMKVINPTDLQITDNKFVQCATGIACGVAGNVLIADNTFYNVSAPITGAASLINSSRIHDNIGYNPVGASNDTPGASPWTYTAGPSPETLYVSDSSGITAATIGGVSILPHSVAANVVFTIQLGPNEAVIITYSGTLTAKTMVH